MDLVEKLTMLRLQQFISGTNFAIYASKLRIGSSVTLVAKFYGIEVNGGGFTSCLFHAERTPSLKLYTDHFYCFGCGKSGDVVALIAEKFNVSQFESAKMIMSDFNLNSMQMKATATAQKHHSEWERETLHLLKQYLEYLKYFERVYAPKEKSDSINEIWVKSIHSISLIEYYIDILTYEPLDIRRAFLAEYVDELDDMEVKLDEYKRKYGQLRNLKEDTNGQK